jgi:hypothetical protein
VARFIALGLDQMATDEDNEPTGLHLSDGDATIDGLIGQKNSRKPERRFSSPSSTAKTTSVKSSRATEGE